MIESTAQGMLASMKTVGSRIKHLRDLLDMTQEEFAAHLRAGSKKKTPTRGAVGNWERDQGIKTENLTLVADRTGVSFDWLANNKGPAPRSAMTDSRRIVAIDIIGGLHEGPEINFADDVPLVGYVGAGAEAHYYAVSDENLDRVRAPDGATEHTKAVEIKGDSLGSLFNHWLVFFDDVRSPVTPDLIGRLCVVGLPDDRVLIKKLRRHGKGTDLYDLLSDEKREAPIEGVVVAWAARVRTMVPK
jgi:transcriptional regulator with XRE-family HTH domain